MLVLLRKSCPKIKSIRFYPPKSLFHPPEGPVYSQFADPTPVLTPRAKTLIHFTNLTALALANIADGLIKQQAVIVDILLASPHMKELGMSLDLSYYDTDTFWSYNNFFFNVCTGYRLAGGKPLKLRVLNFGVGLRLYGGDDRAIIDDIQTGLKTDEDLIQHRQTPATYLYDLVDLSTLEVLYAEADRSYPLELWDQDDEPIGAREFTWSTFTPAVAPKLRRVSTSTYYHALHKWYRGSWLPFSCGLLIDYCHTNMSTEFSIAKLLGSPAAARPTMIVVRLIEGAKRHIERRDTLRLVSSCTMLEGLRFMTGNDTDLTEPATQDLFLSALEPLQNLRQFSVRPSFWKADVVNACADGKRAGDCDSCSALRNVALRVAELCTSLQYVSLTVTPIGACTYHVTRNKDGGVFSLDEMDTGEAEEVELFCPHNVCEIPASSADR